MHLIIPQRRGIIKVGLRQDDYSDLSNGKSPIRPRPLSRSLRARPYGYGRGRLPTARQGFGRI